MPGYIPKPIEKEDLHGLIGKLTPLTTTLEERVLPAKTSNALVEELLDEPELLNTIKTGFQYLRSITCLNEDQMWTSGQAADIRCFNIEGVLQNTIETQPREWPDDIAVDKDSSILYSERGERTVYKVKNEHTEEIIKLQEWKPSQLCVTSSGDFLLTMYSDDETQSRVVR
uniref:Uncharacterized protein LOC111108829 n=1 Tax=Crassostrea virginica TaxID=6565 RepID=A0A8B8BBQ8_CRAVI|nr:uncharacterized protein LOC111108829 [Crassostrea virginica]